MGLPMKMELTEGSETSAIRSQTPGNYPKKNILHIEHGESLKSRTYTCIYIYIYTRIYKILTVNIFYFLNYNLSVGLGNSKIVRYVCAMDCQVE